ncbi:hypothetical protein C0J52_22664 [Blattella germanica]|nr:hypothetical protein C0J52_22664 [Blattella germanica]
MIFSGCTQSNTVDSGIWQHVEDRDDIGWTVVFLRRYELDVWLTYAELDCDLGDIWQHVEGRDGIDGSWFFSGTTNQMFGSCMQSYTLDLRFGSMSRAGIPFDGSWFSSGATDHIFGSCTQSYTVDSGIW